MRYRQKTFLQMGWPNNTCFLINLAYRAVEEQIRGQTADGE